MRVVGNDPIKSIYALSGIQTKSNMIIKPNSLSIVLALFAGAYFASAQNPVITSLTRNGVLVCSNLQTGSVASVEWASEATGPWQTNWAGLDTVAANSNGTISVSVPMFYRVRGVPQPTTVPANMVLIPAGVFTMGDNVDGFSNEAAIDVTVSAFYMDTNLVTYSQWQSVYSWATNHGYAFVHAGAGKAANHPVQTVDWFDCVKWSNARSQQGGLTPVYYTDAGLSQVYTNGESGAVYANWTANGYRLPTEAEWEKAARGGLSGNRFPWGNTISESQANYSSTGSPIYDLSNTGFNPTFNDGVFPYTSPVGSFPANGYGLNDMAGNVFTWCWDWYATPYGQPTTNNPTGPAEPLSYRVQRGGGWTDLANAARCACRGDNGPGSAAHDIGLRCVKGL